jgi:hypothetical protein
MHVYECTFEFCAVQYAGWRVVDETIFPGTLTTYALNLTRGSPLVEFIVLDSTFTHTVTLNGALYTTHDIPGKMANVSVAMASHMLSGTHVTEAQASVYVQENFISVQWAWLSLPAVLDPESCFFLMAMIWQTHRADQLTRKSSLTLFLMLETSYPLMDGGAEACVTNTQYQARTATIVNHLTM